MRSFAAERESPQQVNDKKPHIEEPQFFVNDFILENEKLNDVIQEIRKTTPKYQDKAYFMKKFTNLMFHSYIKNKNSWKEQEHSKAKHETELELLEIEREKNAIEHLIEETEEKKKERAMKKEELKKELERKRKEILKKLHQELEMQEPEEKPTFEEIPMPLSHNLKGSQPIGDEHEALAPSVISEEHEEGAPLNIIRKDLVASAETKKVLAYSEFDNAEYKVREPELNEKDRLILEALKKQVSWGTSKSEILCAENQRFSSTKEQSSLSELEKTADKTRINDKTYLQPLIQNLAIKNNLEFNDDYYDKIRYYLLRDLNDFGIISPLLKDVKIREIVCDGVAIPVHLIYEEKHDINTNMQFENNDDLNNFIKFLAGKLQSPVTEDSPFLITETDKFEIQATLGTPHSQARFVIERK